MFIFGDIEGEEKLLESTLKTIQDNKNGKFIFLGDIYDFHHSHKSIQCLQKIFEELKIDIKEQFNEISEPIDVIRSFRAIWKKKQLRCYKKMSVQCLYFKPEEKPINLAKQYLFIFGNKEITFIKSIVEASLIKKEIYSDGTVLFKISSKHAKQHDSDGEKAGTIKEYTHSFNISELNLMYSYLKMCHNYLIINDILLIHCYFNYKKFEENEINKVIAGHSKAYGKFLDSNYPNVEIYLVDLTDYSEKTDLNNYIMIDNENVTLYNEYRECNLKSLSREV